MAVKDVKLEELKEAVEEPVVVAVIATQNDSSEGLANLYKDLEEPANKLKSSAFSLLLISLFFCGTIEGMFGMIAATSILCCAAPGSLGTAHASRCTRVCALICAILALSQFMVLATFSVVMPHVPESVEQMCATSYVNDPTVVVATQDAVVEAVPTAPPAMYKMPSAKEGADIVVAFAVKSARKLQAVAPMSVTEASHEMNEEETAAACAQATRFAAEVLPYLVMMGSIGELCLFVVAMTTARRALHLQLLARRMGANAI